MSGRLLVNVAVVALVFTACSTVKYIPVKEIEYVTVRDTTVLRDTTIQYQIEKERYTEYTGLLDTLKLSTAYAESEAWVDTTANLLKGRISSKPEKEIQIKWKERTVYRDSIVYKEKPVPYEVEKVKKVVPKWAWYSLIFSIVCLLLGGFYAYLKLKGLGVNKLITS